MLSYPSESSEEEEDIDHLEVTCKHSEWSDIGENSAQRMAKFERHLETMKIESNFNKRDTTSPIHQNGTRSSTLANSRSFCYIPLMARTSTINTHITSDLRLRILTKMTQF